MIKEIHDRIIKHCKKLKSIMYNTVTSMHPKNNYPKH